MVLLDARARVRASSMAGVNGRPCRHQWDELAESDTGTAKCTGRNKWVM